MPSLMETNPALVEAASQALKLVEPTNSGSTREATFVHEEQRYRTKQVIDLHANTFDYWDVHPV